MSQLRPFAPKDCQPVAPRSPRTFSFIHQKFFPEAWDSRLWPGARHLNPARRPFGHQIDLSFKFFLITRAKFDLFILSRFVRLTQVAFTHFGEPWGSIEYHRPVRKGCRGAR